MSPVVVRTACVEVTYGVLLHCADCELTQCTASGAAGGGCDGRDLQLGVGGVWLTEGRRAGPPCTQTDGQLGFGVPEAEQAVLLAQQLHPLKALPSPWRSLRAWRLSACVPSSAQARGACLEPSRQVWAAALGAGQEWGAAGKPSSGGASGRVMCRLVSMLCGVARVSASQKLLLTFQSNRQSVSSHIRDLLFLTGLQPGGRLPAAAGVHQTAPILLREVQASGLTSSPRLLVGTSFITSKMRQNTALLREVRSTDFPAGLSRTFSKVVLPGGGCPLKTPQARDERPFRRVACVGPLI
ncbi:hypothetical protein P7K49_033013 [Saguinus oedipus]|uniref:Uncharacterized protein n=1 Tax=Saguinus oedipus TaxID=9490 RepID=A0ABQ9TQQ3_SAGOE|nr:hypothetical protein P7K49_033013 [Saguinus oedipus]